MTASDLKEQPPSPPKKSESGGQDPAFEWTSLNVLNLAIQQNNFSLVREVVIRNRTADTLTKLTCTLSVSPSSFATPKIFSVQDIPPSGKVALRDLSLDLDFAQLLNLAEPIHGMLSLSISSGDNELFKDERPLKIFTPDQWLGPFILPELTAAFVMPNLPPIQQLAQAALQELRTSTGNPDVDGYQTGKVRAYEILQTCYHVLHATGIRHEDLSPSFAEEGHRFRLPDKVLLEKRGTSLETTLLLASLVEQCHLHPVILVTLDHVYLGCHLTDSHFPDPATDDLQVIRKRVDDDDFTVVETTCLTKDGVTFSQAEASAKLEQLHQDASFICAIDVQRARYSGIRPLPLRSVSANAFVFEAPPPNTPLKGENTRTLREAIDLSILSPTDRTAEGRLGRWQQKLLDLSMRNRLLNVREGKFAIPLLCPDIGAMEDLLAAGKPLTIGPIEKLLGELDTNEIGKKTFSDLETPLQSLLQEELRQRRLWSGLGEKDLTRSIKALYRKCRTDMEDGGVNTLFLALGFLTWRASKSGTCYNAPILLVPVHMDRGAVADGVKLVRNDEDTVVNETLLELLRTEFALEIPGLSPLPTDDSGIDVPLVLNIFRQAVKDREAWEIHPVALLGRFSFGKFVMWHDLTDQKDELAKNPLVKHLMDSGGIYDDGIEVFPESDLSSHLDPAKLFCPLSADSSQLTAVLYSAMGKSFVLHGPPGTGKSQTITNIIAHNLALGRHVLFVSEKKVALDVVHRRLADLGLGPFCLELHSNKSGKADVMRQFEEAIAVSAAQPPVDWEQETRQLQCLRAELDGHVRELHHEFPNGLSAYRCFIWLMHHPEPSEITWNTPDWLNQTRNQLDHLREIVGRLASTMTRHTKETRNSLLWLTASVPEWSPVWERNMLAAARKVRSAVETLRTAAAPVVEAFGLSADESFTGLYSLAVLAQTVKNSPPLPASLLVPSLASNYEKLESHLSLLDQISALAAKLPDWNASAVAKLDVPAFQERLHALQKTSAIVRLFKQRGFLKEIRLLRKNKEKKLSLQEVSAAFPCLTELATMAKTLQEGDKPARTFLGDLLPAPEHPDAIAPSELDRAKGLVKSACELLDAVRNVLPDSTPMLEKVLANLGQIFENTSARLSSDSPLRNAIQAFLEAWVALTESRQTLISSVESIGSASTLPELMEYTADLLGLGLSLRDAIACRAVVVEALDAGLDAFVAQLEGNPPLPPDDLPDFFETTVRRSMLDAILEQSPSLCHFSGTGQEESIRRFAELDARYLNLSRQMVFARLAARLPSRRSGPCPSGTELGIIKRECAKKSRHKPVRLLLEQTPVLTPLLKPCFLMSPLSVAQYLPPGSAKFDLVVFDEASQIPVWDAIGVLARAKQHIIVGDPKQMPPTNFFQKGDADSDDPATGDEVEDMESILEECLAAGMHSAYLDWHYRSRHESLIAFSNHYYYGDRLSTFPAAIVSERLGVRFRFVPDGIYDRRNTRTNPKEAEALVAYVVERLLSTGPNHRSIGIVTFNETQRNLIEDLLEAERSKNKELDNLLADEIDEPLFIKNLESVQGDERDVILFSVCYAVDAEGKFSMNFGPLNRQGGERRLNVAITRAKEQVIVFSSIHGSQIDPSKTSTEGALHLRYFLDYAENGLGIPSPVAAESSGEGLSSVVGDFLESRGWIVERGLGASGCRLDLAVRHPDRKSEYLLGIICDGLNYINKRDIRDQTKLRISVLQKMGWHLAHVWTVDWAFDRQRAESRLLEELEAAENLPPPSSPPAPPSPELEANAPSDPPPSPNAPPVSTHCKTYTPWIGRTFFPLTDLTDRKSKPVIQAQIQSILEAEAPICANLLCRRITRIWRVARMTKGITNAVLASIPEQIPTTGNSDNPVYWKQGQNPSEWLDWRIATSSDDRRDLADIPMEELANAMFDVLVGFHSSEQDTLYRETLKALGFTSLTAKSRPLLDAALAHLQQSGRI
jgi:hypothetical protein